MNLSTIIADGYLREASRKRINGKGFFISYVVAGSGPTGDETALVKGNKFYILNGDWTEEYRPLVKKGYKTCKKFFDSKKDEYENFWSD
jgi:hypothetical protein